MRAAGTGLLLRNETTGSLLATRAAIATSFLERAVGLLSRSSLPDGEALIFPRVNAIHTWFMRFPIDVAFLQRGTVVRVVSGLEAFRMASAGEADAVVELPSGVLARTDTRVGHRLAWSPKSP